MYYSLQIYFGYFGHSAADLFLHMLWKFRTFSEHLPEHQDCFLSGIPDTPRKCITLGIIISVICLGTRAAFFRIFRTLPGHVLNLAYLFQIFRTFSSSFIFVHALKVPHFFRTFTRAPGLFYFGYCGHSQDMYYSWHIYFGYFGHSAAHLFVHLLLMLRKFRIFSGHLCKH